MRARIAAVAVVLLAAGCGGPDTAVPGLSPSGPSDSGATVLVTSSAFADGQRIPERFTCRGAGDAPDVSWKGVPAEAKSVALVVDDPDAGSGGFLHWVIYDLPPGDGALAGDRPPAGAKEADNGRGQPGWTPPCPPSGTHHYIFTVYALPGPPSGDSSRDLIADMDGHFLARGQLVGLVAAG
jgi:Raf kinase inhibitor-like YbhB/YbcL family protein